MNTKKEKAPFIITLICVLIGLFLIYLGINELVKKQSFIETECEFVFGKDYISTDAEGNRVTKYTWYYSYWIDDFKYEFSSNEHYKSGPSKRYDIILYNPQNPSEALFKSDNSWVFYIGVGTLFVIPSIMIFRFYKKKDQISYEENEKNKEVAISSIIIMFFSVALAIIFTDDEFDWKEYWYVIVFCVFSLLFGCYFLYLAYSNNNKDISPLGKSENALKNDSFDDNPIK